MSEIKSNPALLSRVAGAGGDHYIGTSAISDKRFEIIRIGASGATLTDVRIGGVSVKASRNYPDSMPADYLICAEGDVPIDYIELSAGWAEGWIMPEWVESNQ